jgi:hypothetical protein
MRLSIDEHGADEVARYDVYLDGELVPVHAVVEANEEAFYVIAYCLDKHGCREYRALDGTHPGQAHIKFTTQVLYGTVRIVP